MHVYEQPDERRQRLLASLAKARAARAENATRRAAGLLPPLKKVRKKTVKTRLDEAIVQHKLAKKKPALPEDWLAGIHHMPDGCAAACRGGICVITAENVCGHPDTNLQSKYLTGAYPDVTDRFHAAKHELRRLDAEKSLKK